MIDVLAEICLLYLPLSSTVGASKTEGDCLTEKTYCIMRSLTPGRDGLDRTGTRLTSASLIDFSSVERRGEERGHTPSIQPSHPFEPTGLIVISYHHRITTLNINVSV